MGTMPGRVSVSPPVTWTGSASSCTSRSERRNFGGKRARAGATEEERPRGGATHPLLVRVRNFFTQAQKHTYTQLSCVVDPPFDGRFFYVDSPAF
jgi:hypothetical protein